MRVKNRVFEQILKKNSITKKEFSSYSKIPYNTVVGWKKRDLIPDYALVILKDMNYRKRLDESMKEEAEDSLLVENRLTLEEEKIIKSLFWGTNYTVNKIIKEACKGNQKIIKKIEDNLSFKMQKQILGKIKSA